MKLDLKNTTNYLALEEIFYDFEGTNNKINLNLHETT